MLSKRMAALPLIVIISLSALGFAYAMWIDHARIIGTVSMGTLQVVFSYEETPYCLEKWWNQSALTWYPLGTLNSGEYLDKDVGDCEVKNGSLPIWNKPHTKQGYEKLFFNITSAYPSYMVMINYYVHNIGSIPAYFNGFVLTGWFIDEFNVNQTLVYKTPSVIPDWGPVDFWMGDLVAYNGTPSERPIVNVHTTNNLGHQLDPCNSFKGEIDLHFKQTAEECHTYYFEFRLLWVNKYPPED